MWAFWGKKKFFATGFLKIPIFGDFNPKKVIFEGRKMGEKGVNDKILKNPAVEKNPQIIPNDANPPPL